MNENTIQENVKNMFNTIDIYINSKFYTPLKTNLYLEQLSNYIKTILQSNLLSNDIQRTLFHKLLDYLIEIWHLQPIFSTLKEYIQNIELEELLIPILHKAAIDKDEERLKLMTPLFIKESIEIDLVSAIEINDVKEIELLLPLIDINQVIGDDPLLIHTIRNKLIWLTMRLINTSNINLNVKSLDTGNTALHVATNDPIILKALLNSKKFNINARNFKGQTPLIYAVINDKLDAVKLLIKNGADVNSTDKSNLTALSYAYESDSLNNDENPVIEILKRAGAIEQSDPLVEAYSKNTLLFTNLFLQEIGKKPPVERWTLNHGLDESILKLLINNKDYKHLRILMQENLDLGLTKFLGEGEIYELLKQIQPRLFKNMKIADKDGLDLSELEINTDFLGFNYYSVDPNSHLASVVLLPKKVIALPDWLKAQTEYLSIPIHTEIARAYTYRGDRLLNYYLRGETRYIPEILKSIQDYPENNPLVYPIFRLYDELQRRGFILPEKTTLQTPDMRLNHTAINDIFQTNFDRILNPSIFNMLIEKLRRDFNQLISNAPRLAEPLYVYRGTSNDKLLESGAVSYVYKGYLSTSLDPRIAINFSQKNWYSSNMKGIVLEYRIPPDTPCLSLKSISLFPDEEELLLPQNIKITVQPYSNLMYSLLILDPDIERKDIRLSDVPVYVRHIEVEGQSSLNVEPKYLAWEEKPSTKTFVSTHKSNKLITKTRKVKNKFNRTKRIPKFNTNED